MLTTTLKRLTARLHRRPQCPECGEDVRESFCDACGYDLIQRTKDKAFNRPVT